MARGLILAAMLPPHIGHMQLIRWAGYFGLSELKVIVCGTLNDPIPTKLRAMAVKQELRDWLYGCNISVEFMNTDLPDYPELFEGSLEEFDQLWVNAIKEKIDLTEDDFMFASDTYGARFAESLGVKFAPFDPDRDILNLSATAIRRNPFENFKFILPAIQDELRMTVTMFGAESTGKTTMSRHMAKHFNSVFLPEWARPYLESLDTHETNDERMSMIVRGQLASQLAARHMRNVPIVFQDTDLFSTYGYYKIYGSGKDFNLCRDLAETTKSDLYVMMNSDIRFTPDQLRYGGDKRESSDKFWLDILEEFGLNYHIVQSVNPIAQKEEVTEVVTKAFYKRNPIFGYERK